MLQEGLVNLLLNDTATVAFLGTPGERQLEDGNNKPTTGIFVGDLPEGTPLPAIAYLDIHSEGAMTMDGPDPFTITRIQFSCYGANYADSKHLARRVRQVLEAFTGTLNEGTEIDSIHRVSEIDRFEDVPFGWLTAVDVEIAYRDVGT